MDKQKLIERLREYGRQFQTPQLVEDMFTAAELIEKDLIVSDPIPPTIKPSESHVCPKCDKVNVFNTPIDDINVAWLMCSYCNRSSNTEKWMVVSHD